MPRPSASPDQSASHYMRGTGTGEAPNGCGKAPKTCLDAPSQSIPSKETTMFRTLTTAAFLALTVVAAQAGTSDQLSARIQKAAELACAPERADSAGPASHYSAIFQTCVRRISDAATERYQAEAQAKAARSRVAGN